MRYNENKAKRKAQPKPAPPQSETPVAPKKTKVTKKKAPKTEEPELSADQQAILFICQRGHQSLISILQGVNSTRVPVGKSPIQEADLRNLLEGLESDGYLSSTELHDQTTWIATPKARALES